MLNISQTGLKVWQTLQGAGSTEGGWVIVFNVKEAHELETSNDDSECWGWMGSWASKIRCHHAAHDQGGRVQASAVVFLCIDEITLTSLPRVMYMQGRHGKQTCVRVPQVTEAEEDQD
jgi:hypothetical protein